MSMIPKKIAIKSYQLSSTCPRSYAGLNYYHNILGSPNHNSACCLLNAYYHVPRALLGTFQMLNLIFTINLKDKYYYLHFRCKVTMTQKD